MISVVFSSCTLQWTSAVTTSLNAIKKVNKKGFIIFFIFFFCRYTQPLRFQNNILIIVHWNIIFHETRIIIITTTRTGVICVRNYTRSTALFTFENYFGFLIFRYVNCTRTHVHYCCRFFLLWLESTIVIRT